MRIILLIVFIFIIRLSGWTQSTEFFKTYDLGSTTNPLLDNIIEINKSIYTNGVIRIPNQKVLLLKTDETGILIDTNIIGADTGKFYTGTFVHPYGNRILIPGGHENTTTTVFRPYLLFIDTLLEKISDSIYINKFTSFEGNIKINHHYYFGGSTKYNNNGDSLPSYNFLFWKTDSNFNKITSKSIGDDNIHESCNTIQQCYDNNLLLGGIVLNGNQQDWYLVNVDTNGIVMGEYYYGTSRTDYDGIKSISLSNDSCYYLAGIYNYGYNSSPYYYDLGTHVIKLDHLFNTIWSKDFGLPLPGSSVSKIIKTEDNNQAILSQRFPYQSINSIYSQVTKFNNNGDILWSRNYYQGDTTQYIRYRAWDMTETSDKGLAFCGSAIDTINVGPNQQAWLVKTDSLGCDGLHSCNDTALVINVTQMPDTICKPDTTWMPVTFKGRSAQYAVYANNTLVLDSVYYPYTLPLWIDTLIPYVPINTGMQQIIISIKDPWGWQQSDTVQTYVKNCGQGFASEDFYKHKIEIYPNPATTEVHIRIRGVLSGEYTVTLYNMQGKLIKKIITSEPETTLDISQLPQGIYTIRVLGNNMVRSERVVKMSEP